MPCSLFLQVLLSIMIYFFYRIGIGTYILLKISDEHHRSFHFCRAVLSTHSFFFGRIPDCEILVVSSFPRISPTIRTFILSSPNSASLFCGFHSYWSLAHIYKGVLGKCIPELECYNRKIHLIGNIFCNKWQFQRQIIICGDVLLLSRSPCHHQERKKFYFHSADPG
jgi:hypothetical protein